MVTRAGPSRDRGATPDSRAQILTLEAFLASALVLGGLLFALQVTVVTPMSASTSNEHVESQGTRLAAGVLDSAAANGTLKETLLYWNASGSTFHDASEEGFYRSGPPPTPFGRSLERTLGERDIAYNVNVQYVNEGGAIRHQELVHVGTPTGNVGAAARSVTVYDRDPLYDADFTPNGTVENATTLYLPDAAPNSSVYSVVRVEVTVWRT